MPESVEKIYCEKLKIKTGKATCCDQSIVELKESLINEMTEELGASQYYEKAGFQMKDDAGLRDLSQILHKMSLQEYEHFTRLIAMVNILNEICECGVSEDKGGM